MTSNLRIFARFTLYILGLLILAWLLEKKFLGNFVQGTYLCLFEFFIGFITIIIGIKKYNTNKILHRNCFIWGIGFVVVADALFYYFNYLAKFELQTYNLYLIPSFLYSCGYLMFYLGLFRTAGINIVEHRKMYIYPTLITGIVIAVFFYPAFSGGVVQTTNILDSFIHYFIIITNSVMVVISLVTLVYSINSFSIFISLGLFILGLVNFALSSEVLQQGKVVFGFYEYFWAIGTTLVELTFITLYSENKNQEFISDKSISVQFRLIIISFITAMLVLVAFKNESFSITIKMVSIGLVSGVVFAVLFSSFIVEQVTRYSTMLGKVMEMGFIDDDKNNDIISALPLELDEVFSSAFAQNLKTERAKQIRVKRYNELYQKFTHDIRTPLKSLQELLKSDIKDEQTLKAIKISIDSSVKVADSMMNEISSENKLIKNNSSMPALDVGECVERVLMMFNSTKISFKSSLDKVYTWVDEISFERNLVNIINNALEEPSVSLITIELFKNSLVIQDNGKGAESEILTKLNNGESITTKAEGHGIGLTSQRVKLLEAGVYTKFENRDGMKVTLSFKPAASEIILIDDDKAVHLAWRALALNKKMKIKTFYETDNYIDSISPESEVYIDYHLGNLNGLRLAEELLSKGILNVSVTTSENPDLIPSSNIKIRDKSFPR